MHRAGKQPDTVLRQVGKILGPLGVHIRLLPQQVIVCIGVPVQGVVLELGGLGGDTGDDVSIGVGIYLLLCRDGLGCGSCNGSYVALCFALSLEGVAVVFQDIGRIGTVHDVLIVFSIEQVFILLYLLI